MLIRSAQVTHFAKSHVLLRARGRKPTKICVETEKHSTYLPKDDYPMSFTEVVFRLGYATTGVTRRHLKGYEKNSCINENETQEPLEP
jgi:hypothetical protein